MAAPKGFTYTPSRGPLAGMTFVGSKSPTEAYNRYQQARAHTLGFSSYSHQRATQRSSIFKNLLAGFEKQGKVSTAKRTDLLRAIAENQRIETVVQGNKVQQRFALDVDFKDHSYGGSYDMYLRRIGRRTGNEDWAPGETP